MSELHLGKGSNQPEKIEGLLRLYSSKFCPSSQTVRLVLIAKRIEHDIVNINLKDKPDWYTNVHPEGKVPALDTGSKILLKSGDICDYLDKTFQEVPLYCSNPEIKKQEKELIHKIGAVFSECTFGPEEILEALDVFEKELAHRGTTFFGGDSPNMVDYTLWPWDVKAYCVAVVDKETKEKVLMNFFVDPQFFAMSSSLNLKVDDMPNMRKWWIEMRKQPACDAIYIGPDKFCKFCKKYHIKLATIAIMAMLGLPY